MCTVGGVSEDLTFANLIDFLADHEGDDVYLEIGTPDFASIEQPADAFILKNHDYTLGPVEDAEDHNPGGERKAVLLRLYQRGFGPGHDEDRVGTRLFINPAQVSRIEGDRVRAVKVWLNESVYVSLSCV